VEPPARPDASLNASTNLVWDSIECWRKQVGQQLPGRSSGDAPLSVGVAQLQDGRQSRRHREISLLEDKSMSRPDSALARGPETGFEEMTATSMAGQFGLGTNGRAAVARVKQEGSRRSKAQNLPRRAAQSRAPSALCLLDFHCF
jgi:hypothetical protein